MAWDHQPRWPRKTPVRPDRHGPGGGRWRDDGKPNKPGHSWAEVASSVIGHALGRHHGESSHGLMDDVRFALRGGHREHGTGHPSTGPRGSGPGVGHEAQMRLDYPAQMKLRGAGDLTHGSGPEHAPYVGRDSRQLQIRRKYGMRDNASPHDIGEAIRYFSTGGRAGGPGHSTHSLAQHGHHGPDAQALDAGRGFAPPAPQEIQFDPQMARTFRSAGGTKRAQKMEGPATIQAEWGEQQHFAGPWYAIQDEHGNTKYGSAAAEFEAMHEHVGGGQYRKTSTVQAYQHKGPTQRLTTRLADGTSETTRDVNHGDWLVQQQGGEVQAIHDENFQQLYTSHPDGPSHSPGDWADRVSEGIGGGSGKITRQGAFGDVYERLSAVDGQMMTATQRDNYDTETLSHLSLADLKSARDAIALKGSRRSTANMLDSMMVDRLDAEIARRGGGDTEGMNTARHGVDALVGHVRGTRSSGKKIGDRALEHLDQAGHTLVQLHDMRRVLERRSEDHRDSALTPHLRRAITEAIRRQNGSGGS